MTISYKDIPYKNRLETTTVWSFSIRGKWATHKGDYRGNWAPQIPRNLILRYTKSGDWVLDQFIGSGTTLIECKILGRNGIGIDINPDAIEITKNRLNFHSESNSKTILRLGDARNLFFIEDNSIDLIATHPPYWSIIKYSRQYDVVGDLSNTRSLEEYLKEMEQVAREAYRVLKPGKYAGILIGDTRIHNHYVPISYYVMWTFLKVGFALKEDIIKIQWNCKSTSFWREKSIKKNFYLIMHEHLFIFRKPCKNDNIRSIKYSMFMNF